MSCKSYDCTRPVGEPLEVETTTQNPHRSALAPPAPLGLPEAAVFLAFAVFFIIYGVTPLLGGDGLGLVGADEPRYAQIAHEMLVRFDSAHTLKEPAERLRHALSLRPSLA